LVSLLQQLGFYFLEDFGIADVQPVYREVIRWLHVFGIAQAAIRNRYAFGFKTCWPMCGDD
jgi:hypothetical protein